MGIPAGTCSMPTHLTSVLFAFLPNGVQTHFLGHGTLSQDTKSHMYRNTPINFKQTGIATGPTANKQTNKQTNKDEEMALTLPNKDVLYQLILLNFFF